MECGIYFQEKDKAPLQKLSKLRNIPNRVKFKTSVQKPRNGMKHKENGVKEKYDILHSNEAVPNSSQTLGTQESIQLTNDLSKLEISSNEFAEHPELSCLIKNLNNLLNHDKTLSTLLENPSNNEELKNLKVLNLSHCKIKELPKCLSELKNLEDLDLSYNELENLPASYSKLQRLKQLDISNNNFKYIPECVETGMGILKILNISHNVGAKLNIIPCSKYIERFEAKSNKTCNKFPDWILSQKYFNFKECNLDRTSFNIYSFIGKEGSVTIKNFSMMFSNISSPVLDIMIENMVHLEIIKVGNENQHNNGNCFDTIPISVLKNPELIRELDFRGTAISYLPNSVNKLCNLKKLDIGLNCILWLPEQFCELQNLEYLKIDGNNLIMLPENIGNLKSLKEIRLCDNSLTRLPKSFTDLKNLKLVDLYNNVFEEIPNVLLEMNNLECLDLEQNYFATDNIKIGQKLYSALREKFRSDIVDIGSIYNLRLNYSKQKQISPDSDDDKELCYYNSYSDEDDRISVSSRKKSCSEGEENWDSITDSDDEFEPDKEEGVHYVQQSRMYIPKAHGFCPADLHSGQIKAEVASMRAFGSLPTYKEEQGQFDDA